MPPGEPRIDELLLGLATHKRGQRRASHAKDALLAPRCTLPPDASAFTGRETELRMIIDDASASQESQGPTIHIIDGMPGVGKTSLAVHAAHLLTDGFPDGQLFLDLHAHTPGQDPTTTHAALASLLIADDVEARRIPGAADDCAALWRARTAAKRLILVIDNAASTDQVFHLLPGGSQSLVLITSRQHLGDLSIKDVTDCSRSPVYRRCGPDVPAPGCFTRHIGRGRGHRSG